MPRTRKFYFIHGDDYYSIDPMDWIKLVKQVKDTGVIPDYLFLFGAMKLEYAPRNRREAYVLLEQLPPRPE
jgi:hypothetical protein